MAHTPQIVDISLDQMDALCGNAIEVLNGNGLPVMAMSSGAHDAFTPEQRATLRRHVADIVHAPIPTLERIGGGGVRCAIDRAVLNRKTEAEDLEGRSLV